MYGTTNIKNMEYYFTWLRAGIFSHDDSRTQSDDTPDRHHSTAHSPTKARQRLTLTSPNCPAQTPSLNSHTNQGGGGKQTSVLRKQTKEIKLQPRDNI
jgi:hypothetical protein